MAKTKPTTFFENFEDFVKYYDQNQNTIFRVLVNSQKTIADKDRQIKELKAELKNFSQKEDISPKNNGSKRLEAYFWPKVTIGIASYNHSKYLKQCIDSALAQNYRNFEVVIVDDNSSDKKNRQILNQYRNHEKVKVIYKNKNEGISASLNDQIINASSDWIAFLDCDDYLPKNALSQMVRYARKHPAKKLIFSNRNEVTPDNKFIRIVDFGTRHLNPDIFDELIKGMASSHLKMIHKDVFKTVGLFDSKYDGIQDYDIYLRTAIYLPKAIGHLDKTLYSHRIHPGQNTIVESKKHDKNLDLLKQSSLYRKNVLNRGTPEKISVIILSFNRGEQTDKCIDTVVKASKGLNTELIIWDNGSDDEYTLRMLKEKAKHPLVTVHYSNKNLMCSGGRKAASKLASGKYLLFLDNDMEVEKNFIKELLIAINESSEIAAACCKVIFPNGNIQFNGADYKQDKNFIEFGLIDNGKKRGEISSFIKKRDCKWIPGGATLIKKEFFDKYDFDHNFINAYEDNDFYMQISRDGHLLVNAPLAVSVHNHIEFDSANDDGTKQYAKIRRSFESLIKSWFYFYEKWGLIISDPGIFYLLGINLRDAPAPDGTAAGSDELQRQLQDILSSTSWKITKPLRSANYLLKKAAGR